MAVHAHFRLAHAKHTHFPNQKPPPPKKKENETVAAVCPSSLERALRLCCGKGRLYKKVAAAAAAVCVCVCVRCVCGVYVRAACVYVCAYVFTFLCARVVCCSRHSQLCSRLSFCLFFCLNPCLPFATCFFFFFFSCCSTHLASETGSRLRRAVCVCCVCVVCVRVVEGK